MLLFSLTVTYEYKVQICITRFKLKLSMDVKKKDLFWTDEDYSPI